MREQLDIHRLHRKTARAREGLQPPPTIPGNYFLKLFRTQGDEPDDPNDASYPSQQDGKGRRLPGRLLTILDDEAATDTVTIEDPIEWGPKYVYSPYGWIPRLTDLWVTVYSGLLVPVDIPEFFVTASSITAGSSGTVTMVKAGAANTQTFTAWLDHMDGGTSISGSVECFAWLNQKEKKWYVTNRAC